MLPMICGACAFETDRLLVREWHSVTPKEWNEQDLPTLVVNLMTEPVTRSLPPPWRGEYSVDRAAECDSSLARLTSSSDRRGRRWRSGAIAVRH